jgi:hypothetical protein
MPASARLWFPCISQARRAQGRDFGGSSPRRSAEVELGGSVKSENAPETSLGIATARSRSPVVQPGIGIEP